MSASAAASIKSTPPAASCRDQAANRRKRFASGMGLGLGVGARVGGESDTERMPCMCAGDIIRLPTQSQWDMAQWQIMRGEPHERTDS